MTPTRAFGIAVLQRRTFGVASRFLAQKEKAAAERAAAERAAAERDMDTEGRGHRARGVSTHRARPEDDFTTGLRRSSERRARAPVDVALTGLNGACRGAAACGVVLGMERAWGVFYIYRYIGVVYIVFGAIKYGYICVISCSSHTSSLSAFF